MSLLVLPTIVSRHLESTFTIHGGHLSSEEEPLQSRHRRENHQATSSHSQGRVQMFGENPYKWSPRDKIMEYIAKQQAKSF